MRRYIILVICVFFLLLFMGSPLRQIYAPFRYRELVRHYAEKYNLDWLLVCSIIYHESRFRYRAESNKGARGLMQIMPETGYEIARKLGLEDFSADSLFKPRINLEFGCYYFSRLLREFDGDIRLALAAYNAGMGSVYRYYSRTSGYVDIYKYLYPETRHYVNKVNSTYRLLVLLNKIWRL